MYTLERTKKLKIAILIVAIICFLLSVIGYGAGGYELISDGFMNEPLATIIMLVAFFSTVILILFYLVISALQKDIAEQLQIQDKQFIRHKQESK